MNKSKSKLLIELSYYYPFGLNNEKLYYRGLDNGIVNKNTVSGYPSNDTYTNPNDFIQKLSGATNITGAGILLKVMAGDKLNVHAGSWYKLNGVTPDQPVSPLPGLITALLNGVPGISGNKILASQLNSGILNPSLTGFLNTRDATGNSSRPAAWLNIIVLDEQLNPVITSDGKNSYYEQVGPGNTSSVKQYNISGREITKNGYVYIYVSNETPNVNVYWDNLQVTHVRGALLQEEGYYPFGLEMKALCSQAATVTANNYKFNAGTELENSFEVSYYETYFRNYDAQVGRFTGVDVLAENYFSQSPYHFSYNDPISFNDPLGAYPYAPNDQHTGLLFINGEYHFERSYWNYNPYSALGFGNPESPGGGGGPRSFADSKYGYDKYGNYGIWLRYSKPGTYSSETGLPEVVVGSMWVGLGSYLNGYYETGGEKWSIRIGVMGTMSGYIENFTNAKTTLGYGFKRAWYKLKPYPSGFPGNQYVSTFNITKAAKLAGVITFGTTTVIDAYGVIVYYADGEDSPNAKSPLKASTNFGIGFYGLYGGPIGWTISSIYFGIDATIGWPAAIQSSIETERNKELLRQANIINYSDFKF